MVAGSILSFRNPQISIEILQYEQLPLRYTLIEVILNAVHPHLDMVLYTP